MFALGVLSLILIRWNERIGMFFCYSMIATGMIVPGLNTYLYSYSPALLVPQFRSYEAQIKYFRAMYFPTYCHFTPFFIGIVVGYWRQSGKLDLKDVVKRRILAVSFYWLFLIMAFLPGLWNSFGMPLEPVMATLYSLLHRFLWTIGLLGAILMAQEFKIFFLPTTARHKDHGNRVQQVEGVEHCETDLNSISNNNVYDVTVSAKESVAPVIRALQMAMVAFKCAARLCFSLYLTHSIFIRYNWFTSRSLFTFSEQANVSNIYMSVTHNCQHNA